MFVFWALQSHHFLPNPLTGTRVFWQISNISLFHPGEQIITEFFKTDNSQYFFVKISMANNITASLYHLGVEIDNFVMDESNNLGFLQVYSLTQLIQRIVTGHGCFKQTKKVDSDLVEITSLSVKCK